ncbi:MAG: DUF2130 domain-containing protein [Smithellaceae bacterium]|jgi:hypothetical protein|nr:DUF2130 domain-containing protein [Syntrophaceae bacterium]
MQEDLITCPYCGQEFELSEALTGKIKEHLKVELQKEIEAKTAKKVENKYADQIKELESDLKERDEKIAAFRDQERELRKKQRQLEDSQNSIDLEISRRLDEEREVLKTEASKAVATQYEIQLKELTENLEKKDEAIKDFRQQEIELRKKQRELEESKQEAELVIARKLDEERIKIQEAASKKAMDEHRLKDLEKDKVINDLKASLEDMKRKAEQGSMETQGEVLEQDLETQLKALFPHDDIKPVPKGIRGADIIQCVHTPLGHECGILLWETKNTKGWNASWLQKLKDDAIATRATLAILVSTALPGGIARFGYVDGVWVSDPLCALPLAAALRHQLIAVSRERTISCGKNDKMEALYEYLSGTEFKQKIEGIVEAFTLMQDQLNQERRAMEKHWNQREKQIQRVIKNTVGLYGDMQGIIGGQIPNIPALELDDQTIKKLPPDLSKRSLQVIDDATENDEMPF